MYLLVLPAFSWKVVVLEGQCCLTNMSSICCWLSIGSVSSFTCDPIFPSKLNWHPYMIVSGQHDKMKAEAAVSLKTWLWKSHNTTPATICWPKQVIRWVQILGNRQPLDGRKSKVALHRIVGGICGHILHFITKENGYDKGPSYINISSRSETIHNFSWVLDVSYAWLKENLRKVERDTC